MRRTGGLLLLTALAVAGAPAAAGEKGKKGVLDPASLAGTWVYVAGERDGKKLSADDLKKGYVEISKEAIKLKSPDGEFVLKYTLDVTKKPARIELEIVKGPQGEGVKAVGIIALKGDQLLLCYPAMGGETPTAFAAKAGSGLHLFVLKRKK
jgi:uncharacterized protein (TIGR03067 family)